MSGFNISRFPVLKRSITWKKLEQNLFFFFQHSAYLLILKSRSFWFTHISSEFHWLASCIDALQFFTHLFCTWVWSNQLHFQEISLFLTHYFKWKTHANCLCLPNNNVNVCWCKRLAGLFLTRLKPFLKTSPQPLVALLCCKAPGMCQKLNFHLRRSVSF